MPTGDAGAADPLRRAAEARAVILDFDGTLAATRGCWRRIYAGIFGRRGLGVPPDWSRRAMGMTVRQAMEAISREYAPDSSTDQLVEEWRRGFRAVFSEGTGFTPGGGEFVLQVARAGRRVGIASAMNREAIDLFFADKPEQKAAIGAVVTCDEVARCKPSPDVFLECARALGCPMEEAVIFEDSVAGLRGARAANPGHGVVCILSSEEDAEEKRALADLVVRDFTPLLEAPPGPGRGE